MNNTMITIGITLIVTLCVMGIIVGLMPMLAKKGIKVNEVLDKTGMVVEGVGTAVGVANKLFPNNSTIDIVAKIQNYARLGVHEAEQLYIASYLDKNERKVKAKDTIYAALKLLNIERNAEIDTIIEGAIEAECLALGHK